MVDSSLTSLGGRQVGDDVCLLDVDSPGGLRLPVRLTLALSDEERGVRLRHTITAGWSGRGRVLDPLWRLYFSRSFAGAMDRHVHTEFPLMRDLLHRAPNGSTSGAAVVQRSITG